MKQWLAQFLRLPQPGSFVRDFGNRVASFTPVTAGEVQNGLRANRLRGGRAHKALLAVWRRALEECAGDDDISGTDFQFLSGLQLALGLDSRQVALIHEEYVSSRLETAVVQATATHALSQIDRARLQALAAALRVDPKLQARIYATVGQRVVAAAVNHFLKTGRLSDADEKSIQTLAATLGAHPAVDPPMVARLQRARRLWEIDNGNLQPVAVGLKLDSGETCYHVCNATWFEIRTQTSRIDFAGLAGSVRIVKGVRFRYGSVKPRRVTRERLTRIDAGVLYVTSRRVILEGQNRNLSVPWKSVLSMDLYADSIKLEKESGRSPYFANFEDLEISAAVIATVHARS